MKGMLGDFILELLTKYRSEYEYGIAIKLAKSIALKHGINLFDPIKSEKKDCTFDLYPILSGIYWYNDNFEEMMELSKKRADQIPVLPKRRRSDIAIALSLEFANIAPTFEAYKESAYSSYRDTLKLLDRIHTPLNPTTSYSFNKDKVESFVDGDGFFSLNTLEHNIETLMNGFDKDFYTFNEMKPVIEKALYSGVKVPLSELSSEKYILIMKWLMPLVEANKAADRHLPHNAFFASEIYQSRKDTDSGNSLFSKSITSSYSRSLSTPRSLEMLKDYELASQFTLDEMIQLLITVYHDTGLGKFNDLLGGHDLKYISVIDVLAYTKAAAFENKNKPLFKYINDLIEHPALHQALKSHVSKDYYHYTNSNLDAINDVIDFRDVYAESITSLLRGVYCMDIGDKMGLDLQVPMMVSSYFSLGEKKLEKLNEIGLDGQFHRINQLGIVTHSYISHHSEVALGLLKEVSASGHLTDQVKQRFLKIKQENYQECKKGELTSSNRTLIIGLLESGVDTLIEMGQVMVFHYFTQATLMSLMEDVDLNFMRQVQALNAPLVDEVKGLEGRGSVLDSITKKLEIMQTNNSGYSWYKIEETECMKMYEFLAGEALSLEVTQATKVSRHKEHQTYAL